MAAFQTPDAVGAVVADVGHYATKIGWAGDDTPRSYFRSVSLLLPFDGSIQDGLEWSQRNLRG